MSRPAAASTRAMSRFISIPWTTAYRPGARRDAAVADERDRLVVPFVEHRVERVQERGRHAVVVFGHDEDEGVGGADLLRQRLQRGGRLARRIFLVHAVEHRQAETRAGLDAERTEIEGQIGQARAKRDRTAQAVPRSMLAKYDKVRSRRRAETLFPLRGPSCSACDTAIPTQRRAVMAASGTIEMCEGCGALLYAAE